MIQRKFLCKDMDAAERAVGQIAEVLAGADYKSALVGIYESGFSGQEIDGLLGRIKALGIPGLQIAGLAMPLVAECMPDGRGILLNLLLTQEADIEVVSVPCQPGAEAEAAAKVKERLDAHADVRAVELFGSNMELNTTAFMEKAMEGHEDAVLFGTSTIRNLTKRITVEEDDHSVDVEQVSPEMADSAFAIDGGILPDGFVAVIFAGEKLQVKANYALGWKPIGRRLPFELGTNPAKGETVIISINGAPAVDIYREYLGVYPDSFLVSNICEFPLVVERDGINMCMIPLEHGANGELFFMMTLHAGEELRFTFASHDEVLGASRESIDSMEQFGPEALFLTLCGNRLNFLKEDAYLEWDGFRKTAPDYALMHGAGELYYHNGRGGILNSAHLAIGMREAQGAPEVTEYEHPSVESLRRGRTLSLSDRMSTFLSKITYELLDMAKQAQDANKAKSAFLSHMSHEIRTPINAILGMDEMILKESKEEETREYADNIRSAGNNLLGIVNDILDLSKIEAGKMSITPTDYDLPTAIKDMVNVVSLRAKNKGLTVALDIDPALPSGLFGDVTRINQVVTNLLTNAVKYTEVGKVTFIMKKIADGTPEDEEELRRACPGSKLPVRSVRVRVAVKDTGIGIRPEDMGKLFEEYERFDEIRNRSVEGTGLGLSITKEFLGLMGSRLTVESIYGIGSEFGFEIMQGVINDRPVGDVQEQMKAPPEAKRRSRFTAEDARILVVDDTVLNLVVIKNLLKHTKIGIDTADSGAEALRLIQENAYDVIFLDHKMPKMDGPETLSRMFELEHNSSAGAPVISLTSNASTNAREEYIRLGYTDYLEKPINPEELENMLFFYIAPEKIRTLPDP